MAHHQYHSGVDSGASAKLSPSHSILSNMPAITEDELVADVDEPPDRGLHHFTKTVPPPRPLRRPSLLTRALQTDSESPVDVPSHHTSFPLGRDLSRSSTCSTVSGRSMSDLASDDGQVSYQTRASTPNSPSSGFSLAKQGLPSRPKLGVLRLNTVIGTETHKNGLVTSPAITAEPSVEAELGRRRCISFVCGRKPTAETAKSPLVEEHKEDANQARPEYPAKRPSALKFMCPSRVSVIEKPVTPIEEPKRSRYSSPPPLVKESLVTNISTSVERESETTVKDESPRSVRRIAPIVRQPRKMSFDSDLGRTEATRFHEFASSDEEVADWAQESTVHRCRLTVDDTLAKEMRIRQLGAEAEEEALAEEDIDLDDLDDDDLEEDSEQVSDDDLSDGGFQTDDEEGFAASDDDENDSGSDYEWWAPRRSGHSASTMLPFEHIRPSMRRRMSVSSTGSDPSQRSPRQLSPHRRKHGKGRAVHIRPGTPELPDSTDFVCGTFDEDRPLEQAYISCLKERQAAKHRAIPQDIDPTFPQSDPEIDDDEEDEVSEHEVQESDIGIFPFAHVNKNQRGVLGGRTRANSHKKKSPSASPPKRSHSPLPAKHHQVLHSPPPRGLFSRSPSRRLRSPPPKAHRLISPPPSRRGSVTASSTVTAINTRSVTAFLGERPALTHTASLPRETNPMLRRGRRPSIAPHDVDVDDDDDNEDEDDDENEHERSGSTTPNDDGCYSRGAIDIVQGLERKRLRRRQKFYEIHVRKEEKKEKQRRNKRPPPGKGAQRMRQVGIECAVYRGTRMLSV